MSIANVTKPGPDDYVYGKRLLSLVDRFRDRRVAVIGDFIADEFIYGDITRVSREAPVLILKYDSTEVIPGAAGNAANNVAALGGVVPAVGLIGRDDIGRRLVKELHPRVRKSNLVRSSEHRTTVKTRILAGGVHSAKQQVVRIDREDTSEIRSDTRKALTKSVEVALKRCDAVLISDYGSGLVSPGLVRSIKSHMESRGRRRPIPILIDSRYGLMNYRGLGACTPNESEVEQMLGVTIDDDLGVLERAGRTLLRRTRMGCVLITRGSRGMALFESRRRTVHIPIFGSDQISDVTGAGDTVIATLALSLAAGASFLEGAQLANYTGGLVVMKRGTATVTLDELRQAIVSDHGVPLEG